MLHPSYTDLMNIVNGDVEEGEEPVISSRYSIVMATAKSFLFFQASYGK